jgi:hypothetical protein
MTEDQLERECMAWLADVGWQHRHGPAIAPDGDFPERDNYRQVLLLGRLRSAVAALNPRVPVAAREDAIRQVLDLGTPVLLAAKAMVVGMVSTTAAFSPVATRRWLAQPTSFWASGTARSGSPTSRWR